MKSKSVIASKSIWGIVFMAIGFILQAFGFELSPSEQAKLAEQAASFAMLALEFGGAILAIWGRFTAHRKPVTLRGGKNVAILIMVMLLCGCTVTRQEVGPLSAKSTNIPNATTLVDGGEGGTLTSHAINPQHYATFGDEGMEIFSPSPAGAAFIGQSGAAISDPKDASIDSVEMIFDVIMPQTGKPIVYTKSVKITGLNASISGPIRAQAHQWEQVTSAWKKIYETDEAKFWAGMDAMKTVAPAVVNAIIKAVVPSPAGLVPSTPTVDELPDHIQ